MPNAELPLDFWFCDACGSSGHLTTRRERCKCGALRYGLMSDPALRDDGGDECPDERNNDRIVIRRPRQDEETE